MKIFRSELAQSYDTYSFGYSIYAIKESGDKLSDIYDNGFLPYSSAPEIKDTFYMARSVRISLDEFSPNSENRRIIKKNEEKFSRSVIPIDEFDTEDSNFRDMFIGYFDKRHGVGVMTNSRLSDILNSGIATDIVTYSDESGIVGYVILAQDKDMSHFWFSAYNVDYLYQSLGMWLMVDLVVLASEKGRKYMYIGTGYGDKALYKTNFSNIEYWTGSEWSNDTKKLRHRARTDPSRAFDGVDEWKENILDL